MKIKNTILTIFILFNLNMVTAQAETPDNNDVTIQFTQTESMQMTMSSNSVSFGNITGLTDVETGPVIVSVKSSLPYNLDVKATDDFKSSTASIGINHLSLKVDSEEFKNIPSVMTSVSLITADPATYALEGHVRNYNLVFKFGAILGSKSGNYSAPLTLTLTQN